MKYIVLQWIILGFSDNTRLPFSAAIAIFSRMNIGTLDVGDFLGKPPLLFHVICILQLS
jgi:hypothetical protein